MPIYEAVVLDPMVLNGYAPQETTDMLFSSLIHPCMPANLVCKSGALWKRFADRVSTYSMRRSGYSTQEKLLPLELQRCILYDEAPGQTTPPYLGLP